MTKRSIFMRTFLAIAAMAAICLLTQPAFAQRGGGGHAGGGGFHGGGAFHGGGFSGGSHMGYSGGRSYTAYHGSSFSGARGAWVSHGGSGWHGGHGGWHGGNGWYGRGWGRWGYPYGYYGYAYPGYYAPYPYYYPPDSGASDDPDPYNGNGDPPPADPNRRQQPPPNQYGPAKPWRPAPPAGDPANMNYQSHEAMNGPRPPLRSVDRIYASPSAYRVQRRNAEQSGAQRDASPRPEVLRAMQRLREMPPFAREREIEVRYSQFSPEEKELLRNGD